MYAQVEKQKENSFPTNRQESRAVANSTGLKKSKGKEGFGFVDNRPEAVAQRKLQKQGGVRPTDIHVGPGQEKHLVHEAWHAVQQKQGWVRSTAQMKDGAPVNDDRGLKHEADAMGAKAMQLRTADQITEGPSADAMPAAISDSGEKGRLNFLSTSETADIGDSASETAEIESLSGSEENAEPCEETTKLVQSFDTPIKVSGEKHTILFKFVAGELVAGICSDFQTVDEIQYELDQVGLQSDRVDRLFGLALLSHNETERFLGDHRRAQIALRRARGRRTTDPRRKHLKAGTVTRARKNLIVGIHEDRVAKKRKRAADAAYRESHSIRTYIGAAAILSAITVSTVLGRRMPPLQLPSDVGPGDHGQRRYHTGTLADPIPLVFYKLIADYPATITVNDYSTTPPTPTAMPFGAFTTVQAPDGGQHTFGVLAANQPAVGRVWRNTPFHGRERRVQRGLNGILLDLGYDLSANDQDGDHVRDLGFDGLDLPNNYWPLDSTTNRLAFHGWRSQYFLNYKVNQNLGSWNVMKAALNSPYLIGKYFLIKGHSATATPAENNSSLAGHGLVHNATQGTIAIPNGPTITEA